MIYDLKTSNASFIEMAKKLKSLGVSNYAMHLILYDETLQGVDPFDDNLSVEVKAKIYKEICSNIWYYFREISRFRTSGSSKGVPFELNIAAMTMIFCRSNNLSTYVVLPRQIGKTSTNIAFDRWIFDFGTTDSTFIYSNKSDASRLLMLQSFEGYLERYPGWLKEMVSNPKDVHNVATKFSAIRKNRIISFASANSDDAADRMGRSFTAALMLFDEFAFLERNETIFKGAAPAFTTAKHQSRENGKPFGITIATTPNRKDKGSKHGFFARTTYESCLRFRINMFDMREEELHTYVKNNSSNDMVLIEYTWKECGKTKEWYEDNARQLKVKLDIERELELVWPQSDEGSVFGEETFLKIKEFIKYDRSKYKYLTILKRFDLVLIEDIDLSLNYIISVDMAGGLGNDFTCLLILHPDDYRIIGAFINNRIDTDDSAMVIAELMDIWLPNSLLVVETNSYGKAVLDKLIKYKSGSLIRRIYSEVRERVLERKTKDGSLVKEKTTVTIFGVETHGESRPLMFDILPSILNDTPHVITLPELYEDIQNLWYDRNGRIEARPGTHDDVIMAYLITRYALMHGKWFKKFGFSGWKGNPNTIQEARETFKKNSKTFLDITSHGASIASFDVKEGPMAVEDFIKTDEEYHKSEAAKKVSTFKRIIGK